MRVNLVTGACGFAGGQLARLLLERGEPTLLTDRPAAFEDPRGRKTRALLGIDFDHPSARVVPADLTDARTLRALFDHSPTHVFHTASLYDYSAPMEALRRVNIDGFRNLVELAAVAGLERFVHWSTCGVFGKPYPATAGLKANIPFTEESSSPRNAPASSTEPEGTHLVNDYSVTKWEQEQMAWRAHRERGLPLTVIRPAPIYGPGSRYGHGGIVLSIRQGWLPVVPLDARNYITTSVHVEDIARFADWVSRRDDVIGEDFNVVDDSTISQYEFLKYIALLVGRPMYPVPGINLKLARPVAVAAAKAWTWAEKRLGVPKIPVFEVQSAEYIGSSYWISNKKSKDWGFTYRYPDVREGLRDTIDWFRRAGWLK